MPAYGIPNIRIKTRMKTLKPVSYYPVLRDMWVLRPSPYMTNDIGALLRNNQSDVERIHPRANLWFSAKTDKQEKSDTCRLYKKVDNAGMERDNGIRRMTNP